MSQIRQPLSRWKRFGRPILSAIILFHLIVITVWAFPVDTPLIVNLRRAVSPYMLWSGLFQRWNLFSPEPVKIDVYVDAQVTLRDGVQRTWTFPRMEDLSYAQRYAKERYRKFVGEYLRVDSYAALWPDAARHIARKYANPANPPVLVVMSRHFSQVEPPRPDGPVRHTPWVRIPFYVYVVKAEDLR